MRTAHRPSSPIRQTIAWAPHLPSAFSLHCSIAPGPARANMSTSPLAKSSRRALPTPFWHTSSGFRGSRGSQTVTRRWRPTTSIRALTADGLPSRWLTIRRNRLCTVVLGRAAEASDEAVRAWTATRTARAAAAALSAAGVPASPVMTFADLAADAHLAARGLFVDVEHPVLGTQRVMRAPWRFSDWQCVVHRAGPLLGCRHRRSVRRDSKVTPPIIAARSREVAG